VVPFGTSLSTLLGLYVVTIMGTLSMAFM